MVTNPNINKNKNFLRRIRYIFIANALCIVIFAASEGVKNGNHRESFTVKLMSFMKQAFFTVCFWVTVSILSFWDKFFSYKHFHSLYYNCWNTAILLNFQLWNTEFYPLNKSDILINRLLFSHCENIKCFLQCDNRTQLWHHIIFCMQLQKPKKS